MLHSRLWTNPRLICDRLYEPVKNGAENRIRTDDLRFTKPLLYQLSYPGKGSIVLVRTDIKSEVCRDT